MEKVCEVCGNLAECLVAKEQDVCEDCYKKRCVICGNLECEYEYDEAFYCSTECLEIHGINKCIYCEELSDDTITTSDTNEHYCENCRDEKVFECSECGKYFENDNCEYSDDNGNGYCKDCFDEKFTRCEDCNNVISINDTCTGPNNGTLCESCSENYGSCDCCNEIFSNDYLHGSGDNIYCSSCRDENTLIKEHDYEPDEWYCWGKENERKYGIELEVDTSQPEELAETLSRKCNHNQLIYKEDSSIDGVEIVSHPMSLKYHLNFWKSVSCIIQREGATSHKSGKCGIHIHFSKKSVTNLQLGKFLVFINSINNREFIESVAQREHNSYSTYKNKRIKDIFRPEHHHEAVNLEHRNTVEVRIFRGNTRYERIIKCIEFVDAVLSYVQVKSVKQLEYRDFLSWIQDNRKTYINLYNFLVEFNWIISKVKPQKKEEEKCAS